MNSEALAYALHCLPPSKTDPFAYSFHLMGEKGDSEISPRQQHVKLIIPQ